MEVFNFAYGEITGASDTKAVPEYSLSHAQRTQSTDHARLTSKRGTSDESGQNKHQSAKGSYEARKYDRSIVQRISSILDRVDDSTREQKVTNWQRTKWTEEEEEMEEAGLDPENMGISDKDASGPECLSPRNTLMLTKEEKETFLSEGIPLPSGWPFSKTEERALKRVRRKIKNKLSAQESRRKKKEYIVTLEKRVEVSDKENSLLKHKVDSLENTVKALLTELKRLSQNSLESEKKKSNVTTCSRGVQTGRCLKCLIMKSRGNRELPLHSPRREYLARTAPDNSSNSSSDNQLAICFENFSNGEDKDDEYLSDIIPQLTEF